MKKLMITAFAMAVAVVAEAASVEWQGILYDGGVPSDESHLVDKTTGSAISALPTGQEMWLVTLTAGSDLSSSWSVASELGKMSFNGDGTMYSTFAFSYDVSVPANNPIKDGDVLAVVIKDTKLGSYSLVDYYAGGQVLDTMTVAGLDGESGQKNIYKGNFDFAKSGDVVAATVPEPTSGLLLLLGVAGMALRRRRA